MSPSMEKTPSVISSFLPFQSFVSLQDAFAIGGVLVLENFDGGARKAAAVNDGGVIQLVGNDQIVFAENRRDGTGVGREAGLEHHAGFHFLEARDLLFQVQVHLHSAGDGAHGAGADAECARGVNGGAAELGMGCEAEIIIGAEVDDFLAVEIRDWLLLAFQNFQIEVQMLGFQVFDRVVQILKLGALLVGCS